MVSADAAAAAALDGPQAGDEARILAEAQRYVYVCMSICMYLRG